MPQVRISYGHITCANIFNNFDIRTYLVFKCPLSSDWTALASSDLSILVELAIQGLSVSEHLAVFSLYSLQAAGRVLELLLQHIHNIHPWKRLSEFWKISI